MRITNQSVAEFLESLTVVDTVFDSTLRVSINRRPVGDAPGRNAVKFTVVIQASTIVITAEGGEYLLDCGEACGIDYNDASDEKEGSAKAAELKKAIQQTAEQKGWRVLPGIISE